MSKFAVAILGRMVFANYNAFTLGSIVLFFAVGLALVLGGGNGKPSPMHVSAAPTKTVSTSAVAGSSTAQSAASTDASAPVIPTPTPPKKPALPKLDVIATTDPPATTPPTVPNPIPTPPVIPDPVPTPPVIPFSVNGPGTMDVMAGGTATNTFTTSDSSMVLWQLVTPIAGTIALLPEANPVLSASFPFSVTAQAAALVGSQMTFSVHITDTARSIDITKSIVVTVTAAPTPPPVTPPPAP